ncbi:MAG: Uma2 family endonuclease [Chloroflexota bacterium]
MATATLTTAEEFLRWPDDGRHRYELVRGEVVVMAPPGFEHGGRALTLGFHLQAFVQEHGGGVVVVEAGFLLARDPDVVRAPDVAFVSEARLPPPEQRAGFFPGAPDLAIEVVSPNDTATEVLEKVQEYLAAGSRLVWVADARTRRVSVYRADGTVQFLREEDTLSGEDVLPGFTLRVRDIFA